VKYDEFVNCVIILFLRFLTSTVKYSTSSWAKNMHMARIRHINDRHNDGDLPGTDIVYVVFVQYEVLDDVFVD
jgi:hypothetical protein